MAKDCYGFTCLHNVVRSANHRLSNPQFSLTLKDSLKILIRAGADVYATTNRGYSVSDFAYSAFFPDPPPRFLGEVWEEALSACGYDVTWFREDYCRRKHADAGDLCLCRRLVRKYAFNGTRSPDNALGIYNHHTRCIEFDEQDAGSNSNERDGECFSADEQSPQSNKPRFEEIGPDEQNIQGTESSLDAVMQDSSHASTQCDPFSLNSAWGGLAPHSYGTEQTMDDVNIWNQADGEPGEGKIERRPVNANLPHDRSPWGEDLPNADFGQAWDSNRTPQVAFSTSPWIHNNASNFEIEDGGQEGWGIM